MVDAAAGAAAVELYKDGRSLLSYVVSKVSYERDLDSNYRMLIEEANKLFARREDVITEMNRHMMKPVRKECEAWICAVNMAEMEIQELGRKYAKVQKFHRYMARSKLSKQMIEKCKKLHSLRGEGVFERGIVTEGLLEPVRTIHAPKIEDKPSLHWAVEEVLGFLRDRCVERIGLWGMVGIGKTTIMQNLNDNEDIAKAFDVVVLVTASKDCSTEKLLQAIMRRLKLHVESGDPEEIAWRISNELEHKRYLLLLDEVWDVVNLHAIGIRGNQNDSKVVFATRYRDICYHMDADELINLKRLSEADAWKMFQEKVGRVINLPGIEPVARQVVNECAGLPLLIDRVAKSFKERDNIFLWRDGLRSLRKWPSINIQGMDEVLDFLKFCYDALDSVEKKLCFLYGALYPEDHEIYKDYLMECWISEGFLHNAEEFTHARDQGHTILHDLVKVSLLERGEKMNHVRMNKVLRNMALQISAECDSSIVLVKPHEGIKEPLNQEEWKQAKRISLMDNNLGFLPQQLDCEHLSTLLLQRNEELLVIPELFFASMKNLRVLDLHNTRIRSLPTSLSCLTCLRALYLNSCICLSELPSNLEIVKHLEVLDIRGTGINYTKICGLVQLRCLRMSFSNFSMEGQRMEVNQNYLSSLSLLEELSIEMDEYNQFWDEVVENITKQVASLTRLASIVFCFPDVDNLEIFTTTSPLCKDDVFTFQFSVGYRCSTKYKILDQFEYAIGGSLRFSNGEGIDQAILKVLAECYVFELIGHKGVSSLSDFGIDRLHKMRGCLIEECDGIQRIVDGNSASEVVLHCLELIFINNVPKLERIWDGLVYPGSLASLTAITLSKCPMLKKIFTAGLIAQLSKLKHLRVEECGEIEEIIMESENCGLEANSFPSLKTLILVDLPNLKSIWTGDSLKLPCLERMKIFMCQSLMKLPFNAENATSLKSLECALSWWTILVWQDDTIERKLLSVCNFL